MTISFNGTSGVTFPDASTQATAATGFGFKNRILNGSMAIDQRNAGASASYNAGGNTYAIDRWYGYGNVASKFTMQQNAGSVTPPTGFTNYFGVTSSSAYSVPSGEQYLIGQKIEGFNISDLAWGTANAKAVTLSFWVYSSLTGTFGASITNGVYNRSYPFTFTINSSSTWEQKTITIAGDTSGSWITNNGAGINIVFNLGAGSTYSGTAGTWASANYSAPTGATSVVGTNGATFYITGVQLEKGSTATSFDYRPYGTELALCQRYYVKTYNQGTVAGTATANGSLFQFRVNGEVSFTWQFPQVMRTTPTLTFYGKDTGTSGKVSCGSTEFNGGTNGAVNGDKNNIIYATGLSGSTDCYVQAVATAEL